jgi:hypothetical protein
MTTQKILLALSAKAEVREINRMTRKLTVVKSEMSIQAHQSSHRFLFGFIMTA